MILPINVINIMIENSMVFYWFRYWQKKAPILPGPFNFFIDGYFTTTFLVS